jgi:inorganic pyrophosphatase
MQRHVAWIHPDQAKTAKAIGVLLNDDDDDDDDVVVAILKALKRAGIERFRQHDLCHT